MSTRSATIPFRSAFLSLFLVAPAASPAGAQVREPVGPFAVDLRVAMPRFGEDASVAASIGVDSSSMPASGLGLVVGAHWYPLHMGNVTLGIGGELLMSGGSKAPEIGEDDGDPPPVEPGPTVATRFSAVSPQISLNFGSNRGWSYLTGGLGWGGFTTEREDMPVGDGEARPRVFNYGGGARWFAREHLAFTLDLRFYVVAAQAATTGRPVYPSNTMMVFSGGVAFK